MITPRNVYRYDANGFHGFVIQLMRRGRKVQRYVADRAHGGERPALAHATTLVAKLIRALPAPRSAGLGRGVPVIHTGPVRGASKIRGVMQNKTSWCACWYEPPGKPRRQYCGTGRAGKVRAIRVREAAERRIQRLYNERKAS